VAILTSKQKLALILKHPGFWLWVVLVGAVPTAEFGGATGTHYDCGIPFPAIDVKHGNMGTGGGTLAQGWLFVPDGSAPNASGDRTGWFFHPVLIGIVLNVGVWLALAFGGMTLWAKIKTHEP
jgi:hypothetical protein